METFSVDGQKFSGKYLSSSLFLHFYSSIFGGLVVLAG